jgi:hypothetical protein
MPIADPLLNIHASDAWPCHDLDTWHAGDARHTINHDGERPDLETTGRLAARNGRWWDHTLSASFCLTTDE